MSERDTLKATLPPGVHDDLERLFERANDPDPRDIVAELHRQGLLDASQLKAAVLALESKERIRRVSPSPPASNAPEILGQLGAGAMGEVLIAKDPGLNRVVAVKRIHPDAAKNKSMMRRFYTEAQVTAQLDHPGIVPIHGLVQDPDGSLAYAMKLVRGQTLEDFLNDASASPNDPQHALTARLERFLHVCDAMAYAHERGIVHRDLKPENVMVGAFGEVLVMDWGIAKILAGTEEPPAPADAEAAQPAKPGPKATRVGQVMGTPRYMSPEQAEGANDIIDARSDQYALGLILQEVVTLESAIDEGLDLAAVLGWAQQGRRRPMRGAPRELAGIVDKACAKRQKDRYASVQAFAEDIRRYLRDEAPLAVPDGLGQRLQRVIGRYRRAAMLAIVGLSGVTVIGGAGLIAAASAALAIQQYQAQQREAGLTMVLHRAMDRGQSIDAALYDMEALATGLAYAAHTASQAPPPRLPYQVLRDEPDNRVTAGRYGKASMEWASVGVKSGDSVAEVDLERLAALGDLMTEAMAAPVTGGKRAQSADRAKKIGEDGPIAWAHVGTVEGALATAPGTIAYRSNLPNFRKDAWFDKAKEERGATWSPPELDESGLGQVIPVSVPWLDASGDVQGVASLDVSAAWLQKKMRGLKSALGVYLVDGSGDVLLSTETDTAKKPEPTKLPHPQHAPYVTWGAAGWHEASDGSLAVWSPLKTTGWTWVMVVPKEILQERLDDRTEKN